MKLTYLATVADDFSVTPELVAALAANDIQLLRHYASLGVLQLSSGRPLDVEQLDFVLALEADSPLRAAEEE